MTGSRQFLVLSSLGPDEPGLVARISGFVADRGGNIEDSRMVSLGGVFGLMLLVSAAQSGVDRITADLARLERELGLRVVARAASDPSIKGARTAGVLLAVTASAFDREGLVSELAEAMRSTGGNIVEMDTTTYDDPATGRALFQMQMTVEVDRGADVDAVRAKLSAIAVRERIHLEVKLVEGAGARASMA